MFKVNPSAYNSVFVVPSDIVDKHLRLAGSAQLKVLLWIYRHSSEGFNMEKLTKAVGLSKADVKDAVQYWLECGLLLTDEKEDTIVEKDEIKKQDNKENEIQKESEIVLKETQQEKETNNAKTPLRDLPVLKPTQKQIADRISESPEIRELFLEAQNILGRTIGYAAQATLLMIHDHYGLPVPVIMMICEYARSKGKQNSMNYIQAVGKDWAQREIDSFEKAAEQIKKLESIDSFWFALKEMTGISTPKPTASQQTHMDRWLNIWHFSIEMVYVAYEKAAEKTGNVNFNYMNGILKSWHEKGIKNLEQLKKQTETKQNTYIDNKKPSYDLDEAERKAMYEPPVYKKRVKNNGV